MSDEQWWVRLVIARADHNIDQNPDIGERFFAEVTEANVTPIEADPPLPAAISFDDQLGFIIVNLAVIADTIGAAQNMAYDVVCRFCDGVEVLSDAIVVEILTMEVGEFERRAKAGNLA